MRKRVKKIWWILKNPGKNKKNNNIWILKIRLIRKKNCFFFVFTWNFDKVDDEDEVEDGETSKKNSY